MTNLGQRFFARFLSLTVVASTMIVATGAHPALAAKPAYAAPKPQTDFVTPGHTVAPAKTVAPFGKSVIAATTPYVPAAPVWPTAGTFPAAATGKTIADTGAVRFAGSPVTVRAVPDDALHVGHRATAAPALPARVRVLSHPAAVAAGFDGTIVELGGAAGSASVQVSIDYSGFATAHGADWSSRLRLTVLPACALTTPAAAACRGTVVPTHNDVAADTVSATVHAGSVVALDAGPSGGAGDFSATTLSPSGTWNAGDSSGNFTWSYPLRAPPGLNGPVPNLVISYSSASVDGRMAASNNQPSWLGEGFDAAPGGYIERSYKGCADDMGSGANNTAKTGDECWATNNATLSLGSHVGDLLVDPTDPNRWHLRDDDGTYISHRTGNTGNGDNDGEWWVVTTGDGVQYWFGGTNSSNSTLLVPVAGNNAGEPCHAATFAASFCTQAWRWNLDHVVDRLGNTMTYVYTKETNKYAENTTPSASVSYDRGAYLNRIDYGTRVDTAGAAPVSVVFTTGDRCLSACTTHDAAHWPDTPWDQECTGNPCYVASPTYWTTRRLLSVTTELWSGTAYTPVSTWSFGQSFSNPGDGTRAGLVLNSISQTGYVRVTTSVPDITFAYTQLNNRVDPALTPDHSPPMNWARIAQIMTETGERIEVTYAPPNCVAGTSAMPDPNALQNNTLRCYPVKWTPPGYLAPITDFFHKYVVQEVHEVDTVTPNNPTTVIQYQYLGTPAWHYTDDDGLIKPTNRTWSVWRGYGDVRTLTGVGADQMVSEKLYYRGMNGDYRPGGNLVAAMPAVDMNANGVTTDPVDVPATPDEDAYAGQAREQIIYNGTAQVSSEVDLLRESDPTASRTINGVTVYARFTNVAQSHASTTLDGGRAPRTTATTWQFNAYGEPVSESKSGDEVVAGDEKCTLTEYDQNLDTATGNTWLLGLQARQRVFSVDCAHLDLAHIDRATVVADVERFYDSATSITTPPTVGLLTRQDTLTDWVAGVPVFVTQDTSTYDTYGRAKTVTDIRGNTDNSTYTANAGGQLVSVAHADSLGWAPDVTTIEPAFGVNLTTTDTNNRVTTEQYDGMGRLVATWQPGRDATQTPSTAYTYTLRNNAPTGVTTAQLTATGVITSYQLYDGLLRLRQTQSPRGDGLAGALIGDTFYDTAGRGWKTYQAHLATVTPSINLFVANEQGDIPSRTEQRFDAAGRVTDTIAYIRGAGGVPVEFSRTSAYYAGDRTDITPPSGGVARSTYTDIFGNTTAIRQYHGATPTPGTPGSYDEATYSYDVRGQILRLTDPAGNVWTHSYDLTGQLVDSVEPDRGATHYTYNTAGDLTSVRDSRAATLAYEYDALGRKIGLYNGSIAPANKLAEWDYDGLPNSRGHLTKSVSFNGTAAYVKETTGFTVSYQATGVKYTIPATETGLAGTFSYVYTYLPDGSPQTVRMPDIDGAGGLGLETVTTDYNTLGLVNDVKSSLDTNTTYVSGVGYTGYGEMATVTLRYRGGATATLARSYDDGTRRLSQLLVSRQTSPTTLADLRMKYDPAGNTTRISDVASGDNQCFRYDSAERLSDAWTPAAIDCDTDPAAATLGGPAAYREHWTFNPTGTRATQVQYGTATGTRTTGYQYDSVQPHAVDSTSTTDNTGTTTASWFYDPAGNTITRPAGTANQTLTWNTEGQVASASDATGATTFVYDADGQRLIRRDPGGKTLYLPGQELRYTTAGGVKACTRYYTVGGTQVAMRTTAGVTWLAGDPQGTVGVTIDATTQTYAIRRQDPYGNARGTVTGSWPAAMDKGFVGGTKDNIGLTDIGVREYDPVIGRFASPDPVLHPDVLGHFDTYGYGLDNPFGFSDPTGADPYNDGQYYEIGNPVYITTDPGDGFIWHFRFDFYILCRHNGEECLGVFGTSNKPAEYWVPAWQLFRAVFMHVTGVRFKIFGFMQVRRIKEGHTDLSVIGPPIRPPSTGLKASPPPPPEKKTCAFSDLSCAFSSDWSVWWNDNGGKIKGTIAALAFLACIPAMIEVGDAPCALGAGIWGPAAEMTGRTVDFAADHWSSDTTSDSIATMDYVSLLAGYAWDAVGGKLFDGSRLGKFGYGVADVADQYGVINGDPSKLLAAAPGTGATPLFTSWDPHPFARYPAPGDQ